MADASPPRAPDDEQRRALLAALADGVTGPLILELLDGARTQPQLMKATGLDRPTVSRSLKLLRALRLVASGDGRGASHQLRERDLVLDVIDAGDALAAQINATLAGAQRQASKRAHRARLRDADDPDADGASG